MEKKKDDKARVGIALIILIAIAIAVMACSSKRRVTHAAAHEVSNVAIRVDTTFARAAEVDSTLHTWDIRTIRSYREDGSIQQEDIREQHREQRAVTTSSVEQVSKSELQAHVEQESKSDSNTEIDATTIVRTTSNIKYIVLGVLALVAIISIYIMCRRFKLPKL